MKKKLRYETPGLVGLTDDLTVEGSCTNGSDTTGCNAGTLIYGNKCGTGGNTEQCYSGTGATAATTCKTGSFVGAACWCCQTGSPNWFPYSCYCNIGGSTAGVCGTGSKTDGTCSSGSSAYGWCTYS
jgi:hypothetical protein